MTTTGASLLSGLSRFIGDEFEPAGLSTSAAGDSGGTTLIDETLGEFDDDALVDMWVRITQSGSNQYAVRRIVKNESVSGLVEVRPAFAAQVASADTYEIHRYNPRTKFTALDESRIVVYPALGQMVRDDTTTGDGLTRLFDIPSALRRGPVQVYVENSNSPDVDWNFLTTPLGDSTTGWTASSLTLSTRTEDESDLIVPKVESTCQSFAVAGSTNGMLSQAVAAMSNGVTAATAAGRKMTAAFWVYCTTASRVTVKITDDSGATTGTAHQGRGWELIFCEKTISPTNATTLTVTLDVSSASAAVYGYAEHRWFYYGSIERISECYHPVPTGEIRRDNATQQVLLTFPPARGSQVRMVGRQPLSALGTTASTQVTATMEVDEYEAELLYAEAAKMLFTRLGLNLSDFTPVSARVAASEARLTRLKQAWGQDGPAARVKTMWL